MRIDTTPPEVRCPPEPTVAVDAPLTLTAAVADAGSGPRERAVPAVAETGAPGRKTVRIAAQDVAGNTGAAECAYTVVAQAAPSLSPPPTVAEHTPPPDTLPPGLNVRVPGAIVITRRTLLVSRVTCTEPCRLTVASRLGVRGGKPVRFRLLANARVTLRLRPIRGTELVDARDVRIDLRRARRAALTALRAGRRVVVRIRVTAADAAGNTRRTTRFVAVRR